MAGAKAVMVWLVRARAGVVVRIIVRVVSNSAVIDGVRFEVNSETSDEAISRAARDVLTGLGPGLRRDDDSDDDVGVTVFCSSASSGMP